jgi:hypothetical protein
MSPRLAQLIALMPTMRTDLLDHADSIKELYSLFDKEWRTLTDEMQTEIEDLHGDLCAEQELEADQQYKQDCIDAEGEKDAQRSAYQNMLRDGWAR